MWRHLATSLQGPSHEADGLPCQDSHLVRVLGDADSETLVACAADGAGSAKHSDVGSALACESIAESAAAYFDAQRSVLQLSVSEVVTWCESVREKFRAAAELRGISTRELATTVCVAILAPEGSMFFQIGDGAMTVGSDGVYGVVFWPQSGEYANVTNFITSNKFEEHLEFLVTPKTFKDIAIFTDGIERLALDFESQSPHLPFFGPLFEAVRSAPNSPKLEADLSRFLQSDSVKHRSDDDKTLILATRTGSVQLPGADDAVD